MVKKEPKVSKQPAEGVVPETPDQKAFFNQLGSIITESQKPILDKIAKLEDRQEWIDKELKQTEQRTKSIAATAPPQQMNPMEIMKMITDLLNSPIINKLIEKVAGGEEEPVISQSQVPPGMLDFYNDFFKQSQNLMLENQRESMRALRLKNDVTQKEIDSDL